MNSIKQKITNSTKQKITDSLKNEGFCAVGFCGVQLPKREQARLREFIANGEHGTMEWMERHLERRINPKTLMAGAKTIIIAAINYAPTKNPMENLQEKSSGNISVYARNKDYHDVVKKKLRRCATLIAKEHNCDVKIFVDTAPLAEKPLAALSAIGWQGKHSNLVSKEFGSWLLLGEIITDLHIPIDEAEADHCGSCRKCLDICPTQAFVSPYKLDARKCLSYLTIEHKGSIPVEFRKAMGNRIYGCDDCLAICPWNKFAKITNEIDLWAKESLNNPPLENFLLLDDLEFRKLFSKSPVKRIGYERFMRNVLIATGNSNNKNLIPLVQKFRSNPSQILAESASWALNNVKNQ